MVKNFLFNQAVSILVSYLAATVKSPHGAVARKIRQTVQAVHDATGQFLALVPEAE